LIIGISSAIMVSIAGIVLAVTLRMLFFQQIFVYHYIVAKSASSTSKITTETTSN